MSLNTKKELASINQAQTVFEDLATAKHNLNMALRSCYVLSRRDQRSRVTRFWNAPDANGVTRKYKLELESTTRLPWFRDNELLMVFITIAQRQGSQVIHLSKYELLKWFGLTYGKENYDGLIASMNRLASVIIRGHFWEIDEEGGHWEEQRLWDHLIHAAEMKSKKDTKTGEVKVLKMKITLGDLIWNHIKSGNLLTYDWEEYRKLKGDSVKALYLYVQAIRVNEWEVDIKQLSQTHLGMSEYKHFSRIWEKLKPILTAACQQGVIHHFERVKRGKYIRVRIQKSPSKKHSIADRNLDEQIPDEADLQLLEQLKQRGVGQRKAVELAVDPPTDYALRLNFYDFKLAGDSPPRDPPAYLVWLMQTNKIKFPRDFEALRLRTTNRDDSEKSNVSFLGLEPEIEPQRQRVLSQQDERLAQKIEELRERYGGPTALELDLWPKVLGDLELQMTKQTFESNLTNSLLLSLRDDKSALVGMKNKQAKEWAEGRLKSIIQRTLANHLNGQPVDMEFVVL
jgi:hypothetical protein